jgi:hypothetical protein
MKRDLQAAFYYTTYSALTQQKNTAKLLIMQCFYRLIATLVAILSEDSMFTWRVRPGGQLKLFFTCFVAAISAN